MSTNEYVNTTECHNRRLSHSVKEEKEEDELKRSAKVHLRVLKEAATERFPTSHRFGGFPRRHGEVASS